MNPAIAHLLRQESLNYVEAARTYEIVPTTLAPCHKGLTVSRTEATSIFRQRLNNVQEDTLLAYINALTNKHIPPTTQIIMNLAEEIAKGSIPCEPE